MKKEITRSAKRSSIIFSMIASLLISVACGVLTGGTPSATSIPSNSTPDSGAVSVESTMDFGPGAFNYPDTTAGLADLSSYKATLTLTFDGTEAGQPLHWTRTYIMLAQKEPQARQLTIEKTGETSELVFMAEINGAAYERRGENACTASVIEEGNSSIERLEPAGLLSGVVGAEVVGDETINGVTASHATFDERAFGQLNISKSTGEMWVASEGGYVLKYLLKTEGNADYFGERVEGTLIWDYELSDINQTVGIILPDNCPAGKVNAPVLPDASNVLDMPGLLTFNTSTTLADAASFYQEQIPALGWTLLGEPSITETNALMEFTQGDQTLTIIMTIDAGVTTVNIILNKAPK